jgi:hypothetical protein
MEERTRLKGFIRAASAAKFYFIAKRKSKNWKPKTGFTKLSYERLTIILSAWVSYLERG